MAWEPRAVRLMTALQWLKGAASSDRLMVEEAMGAVKLDASSWRCTSSSGQPSKRCGVVYSINC